MANPTKEELNTFWNRLQGTLNAAGANIDLNRAEDVLRLRIANISDVKNPETGDYPVTISYPFCEKPDVDLDTVTDSEFLAMQKPGIPNDAVLTELYTAARDGRLLVNSLNGSGIGPRALIMDRNGNQRVLPDRNHATDDVAIAEDYWDLRPPKKTAKQSISLVTRIKAFFGDVKAKDKIRIMNLANRRGKERYALQTGRLEEAKKMDPEFRMQAHTAGYCTSMLFLVINDKRMMDETRLTTLATSAHLRPQVEGFCKMTETNIENFANTLSGMMKENPTVSRDAEDLVRKIVYQKLLLDHVAIDFNKMKLTQKELDVCTAQVVKNSPEYEKNFEAVCGGKRFDSVLERLTPDDYIAFTDNPAAATESLCKKCLADLMGKKDAPAATTHPKLDQVKVREPAKEAPASDRSAFKL